MEDKTSWGDLPKEIRLAILEALLQDGCSLASLATVSREWQTTIERHNFARITLTPSRLPSFGLMTNRNRALVRYIWVCLELKKYSRPYFNPQRDPVWRDRMIDSLIFTTALDDLLSALSAWEPQGDLVLDISIYSPSDSEYWFKELTFVPDFPSAEDCERALCGTVEAKRAEIDDDEDHDWTGAPPKIAITTTFDMHMIGESFESRERRIDWWERIPSAPAVTSLVLRQQNRRRWNPLSVMMMLAGLPGVREVHYEPWREWHPTRQRVADGGESCCDTPFYSPVPLRGIFFDDFLLLLVFGWKGHLSTC